MTVKGVVMAILWLISYGLSLVYGSYLLYYIKAPIGLWIVFLLNYTLTITALVARELLKEVKT